MRLKIQNSAFTTTHGTGQATHLAARKRLPRTQTGRRVHARDARLVEPEGGDALLGHDGRHHGRRLLGRRGLPRPQGRAGLRSRHPHRHHRRRHGLGAGQEEHAGTERHHPVDRRLVGRDRRRGDLHPPGPLHPGARRRLLAGVPFVAVRRTAGHRAADPLPQILRQGDARQIPLPRGHGDHRSPRLGREGRIASQTAGRRGPRGRSLRLRGRHVRPLDRIGLDAHLRMGRRRRRQIQGGLRPQHLGRRAGTGLHHRPEIRHDHHRRIVPRVVRDRPGGGLAGRSRRSRRDDLAVRRDARRHPRRPAVDLHGREPLRIHRQAHRHRRHRHGGHHRHHPPVEDHPSGRGPRGLGVRRRQRLRRDRRAHATRPFDEAHPHDPDRHARLGLRLLPLRTAGRRLGPVARRRS